MSEHVTEGQCLCGAIRYRLEGQPLITMACHCRGCQRLTSSAYSLSTLYPANALTVAQGQPEIGALHGATQHFYCGSCKSWLYTFPAGDAGFVNVRSTLLDNAAAYQPFIDCYTKEQLPWAQTGAIHRFEGFPEPADYARLIPEFKQTKL